MSNNTLKLKGIHYILNGLKNYNAFFTHDTKMLLSCYLSSNFYTTFYLKNVLLLKMQVY